MNKKSEEAAMQFKDFLVEVGCNVEVTQEDDGSGYECLSVTTDAGTRWEVTVAKND